MNRVVDLSSGGKWKLIDCTFNAAFAHPLLIKSAQGIELDECHVYGSDMGGLCCGMASYWDEGPPSCNITLKNNTFYDNDGLGVQLGIDASGLWSAASHDQRDLDVEGNLFVSAGYRPVWNNVLPQGVGLGIANTHSAIVRDNVFVDIPNANIALYTSDDVRVTGNTFVYSHQRTFDTNNDPKSVNIDAGSLISVSNSRDVHFAGNVSYVDGPYVAKPIAIGADTSNIIGAQSGMASPGSLAVDFKLANVSEKAATETITVPKVGKYRVVVMYSNGVVAGAPAFTLAPASGRLVVNGKSAIPISFENNGVESPETPELVLVVSVTLKAGANRIAIEAKGGRVHIGKMFVLYPAGASKGAAH